NYSDPEEDFSWEPLFDGDGLNTTTYTTAPLDEYDKYYRLKATCSATSDVSYSTYVFVPMFEPPVVSLVSNPANALICSSGSVELSVTGSDIDQYLWSPGTNLTPNVNASTVMVSPPSTRSYSVTATNASGCTATEGITVRVELNPTATTTASPTTICEDGTVVLTTVAAPVPAIDYSNPVVRSANSNSINLAIPDATNELFSTTPGAVVNSALSVSGGPYAPQAITVHISTTHPANSDLEFWLQGPANCGTMEISTRNGGNIGNYSNARFTAPAGVLPSPPVGSTNMSGSYRAEGNLSTGINIPGVGNPGPLSGCPVNGTWTLYMRDVAAPFLGSSAGTLTNWQIHISEPGSGNYTHTVTGGTGVGTASSTVYSGTSNSTGQIIMSNITPGVNRSFIVTTTAPSGCTTTSSTGANITIHPLPVVTCPGPSSICVLDAAYTLEGGLPVDGTYSGNGVSAGMFDPAAAGPGVHTITYSYTNVNNCTNTCSFDITVIPDTDGDGLCAPEDDCPTVPGQVGSTCDANPGPGFTLGQLNGSCNCIGVTCTTDLSLDITMPTAGLLPVWELRDRTNDVLVQSGGGTFGNGGTPNQQLTCLPDGRFYLVITGMPAGGRYVLRTAGNPGIRLIDNRVAAGGGNQVVEFTNSPAALSSNGPVQLPVGPTELLFTSCDKYFWKKGEFIVVNEDADVAAVWVPSGSNAVQSSTTGYDFWFYDPNGGYSFIRQRRHNVSDGFGNVGSSRTCHMQVNNWAAANWIPSQQRLNVRVRAVVNNVPKNWGPACRFVLDETLALCPPTWLMDVPGNPFISCNVTRAYNTQSINRIYARPVTGATKYRFSFNNAELSTPIVREVTTYYLTLGWGGGTAPILQNGQTYDVTVQAFVNGAYCVVGQTCSVTICNNPPCNQFNGGQQNSAIDTPVSNASLNMWPNPNRGDQLFISISAIEEGVTTVSMDLFDLSGKRMVARTIATQGGNLNTVVDLNGDLAAGMYLVQFTAGDRTYTQRLVIQP
ncbi:MAG: T9SS type A sorting domain-containing protein, partial [Flavobacteriales bacterium]|nr:T9SS type A sorting domain-containing protein [Flavobacteriales bacterium]